MFRVAALPPDVDFKQFVFGQVMGDFDVSAETNKWCRIINEDCLAKTSDVGRGVVITGAARGGTSLLASMFFHIGLPMGKNQGPRYEDNRLQKYFVGYKSNDNLVSDDNLVNLKNRIKLLETTEELWGWKLPAITADLKIVNEIIEDPIFIFIFKGPFSVATRRESIIESRTFIKIMKRTLRTYLTILQFAESSGRPCLLVSYEEFVENLDANIPVVARFAGFELSDNDVKRVRAGLQRDSVAYRAQGPISMRYVMPEESAPR